MRPLAALLLALALTGCATSTLNTPKAVLVRTEIDAELAYQTACNGFDTLLIAGKLSQQAHDADKRKAWNDLQAFRLAYNAGKDLTDTVTAIQADVAASKGGK